MHGSDRTYPSPYSDLNPDYPAPYVHPHLWANGKIEGLRCLQEEGEGGWEDGMGIKTGRFEYSRDFRCIGPLISALLKY